MIDAQDLDAVGVVVDGVQDSVGAASGSEEALELPLERLAHATRGGGEVTERELYNRGDDPRRDALKVTPRRGGNDDLVAYR